MMNIDEIEQKFKNHVAKFTDYGNIKILDFKNPISNEYRIRFLFEEDYFKLHISGDLGDLTATNYRNMTFDKFSDFVNDVGYFNTKINCMNRHICIYDIDKARNDIIKWIEENDIYYDDVMVDNGCDSLDELIDDILEYLDDEKGIIDTGREILFDLDEFAFEIIDDIGKENTGILDLYMLAFELAIKNLKDNANGRTGVVIK